MSIRKYQVQVQWRGNLFDHLTCQSHPHRKYGNSLETVPASSISMASPLCCSGDGIHSARFSHACICRTCDGCLAHSHRFSLVQIADRIILPVRWLCPTIHHNHQSCVRVHDRTIGKSDIPIGGGLVHCIPGGRHLLAPQQHSRAFSHSREPIERRRTQCWPE